MRARRANEPSTSDQRCSSTPRLPRDLTKLTAEQVAWCVAYHAALPLVEIRRRQELTDVQIGMAWQQRNDFALANLRVREEILRRAAEGKLPRRRAPSALRPARSRCVPHRDACRQL